MVNSDNAAQAISTPMAKSRDARLDRVREIGAAAVKRPSNLEIIRAAGEFVGGDDAAPHAEAMWRACSGAAHGDTWAGLNLHDKDTVSREGNVATLGMTASTELLTTITTENSP